MIFPAKPSWRPWGFPSLPCYHLPSGKNHIAIENCPYMIYLYIYYIYIYYIYIYTLYIYTLSIYIYTQYIYIHNIYIYTILYIYYIYICNGIKIIPISFTYHIPILKLAFSTVTSRVSFQRRHLIPGTSTAKMKRPVLVTAADLRN